MLKPLPDDLSVVIGDALQNLRNSLDNLAYSLGRQNHETLTSDEEQHISFPIYDGAVPENANPIRLMPQPIRDEIRALAPDPARRPLDRDPLWLLNKTANRDKHRHILVVASACAVPSIIVGPMRTDLLPDYRPMEFGADPVRLGTTANPDSPVPIRVCIRLQIQFAGSIEVQGWGLFATLWGFHDYIRDTVFKALEPHLTTP